MVVSQRGRGWGCTDKSPIMCCRSQGLARVPRQSRGSGANGWLGVRFRRSALCLSVKDRPQLDQGWVVGGALPAISKIEPVVEIRRIRALSVLKNGLELVEGLGQPGFGRAGSLILVPE